MKATGNGNRENFTLDENFDSNKKTKFIIHGWKNKYTETCVNIHNKFIYTLFLYPRSLNNDIIQMIKDAYVNEDEDLNIIGVDWSEMAGDNNYLRSAGSTREVGRNIAAVINHMIVNNKAKLNDIHLIGHSKYFYTLN